MLLKSLTNGLLNIFKCKCVSVVNFFSFLILKSMKGFKILSFYFIFIFLNNNILKSEKLYNIKTFSSISFKKLLIMVIFLEVFLKKSPLKCFLEITMSL